MNERICCFTGHRTVEPRHLPNMPSRLSELLEKLYDRGFRVFRTGGALGFDTVAALSVLGLRKKHPDVRLHLILPCRDQTAKWRPIDVEVYNAIRSRADAVTYAEDSYTPYCMHKRNRMLVDGAHCCIAYYNGGGGGTRYTYDYAQRCGVKVINVGEMTVM